MTTAFEVAASPAQEKRTDIGYKRPPAEHQFKKGHTPKPRKLKPSIKKPNNGEILWKILQEERRVVIEGKVQWIRIADLIVRRMYELADKGNSTMRRLSLELLMRGHDPIEDEGHGLVMGFIVDGVEHPFAAPFAAGPS